METSGKFLAIYDSQFCPKRLQNVPGFLVRSGSGMAFTTEPRVALVELEVAEGDTFNHIVVSLGTDGIWRRIKPGAGADGVLKADGNGHWILQDISTLFTVPDPLTIGTINVATLNAAATTISGLTTFSAMGTDTITQTIGLNAANELIKGSTPTISVASYFENSSLTDAGTPNWYPSSASDYCIIGNELSDPDGIASVQDSKTINIDVAGDYLIRWRGNFEGWKLAGNETSSIGDTKRPGIWLVIANSVVNWGTKNVIQTKWRGSPVFGEHYAAGLAVNTKIKLQLNGSIQMGTDPATYPNRTGLTGAGLTLTKVK